MPWADEAEQQLSRLALSSCQLSADVHIFRAGLPERAAWTPKATFEVRVARQATSPSLCASVQAVPCVDEAEQQLSRLALSGWELYADVRIFGAGMVEAPGTDHLCYV